MRTRSAGALTAVLLGAVALTGCGGDDDTASDPGGPSETTGTTPTPSPTVGTYPHFEPDDYAYTLRVSCFCPEAGDPLRITVRDGVVAEAVDERKGDPAPPSWSLTINDVIDELNESTDAETVRVDWPAGQDYPSEVSIDQSSRIADEEIGYAISDVVVG